MSIDTLLNRYTLAARAGGLSSKTVDHVKLSTRLFSDFLGGIPDVRKVTGDDLRRFIVSLQQRPRWAGLRQADGHHISGTSVNTYTRGIKSLWSWMTREGHLKENPLAVVASPKLPKRLPKILNNGELTSILKKVRESSRDSAILELLIDSGIRLGELADLEPGDIDKGVVRVVGKGDKERHAFISEATELSIHTYIVCDRPDPVGENKLFLTEDGRPLTRRRVQKILERIGKRAEIVPRLSPHKMRHSCATLSLKNGANLEYVRRLLGHSDIKSTEIYLHLVDKDVQDAHRQFSPMAHLSGKRV